MLQRCACVCLYGSVGVKMVYAFIINFLSSANSKVLYYCVFGQEYIESDHGGDELPPEDVRKLRRDNINAVSSRVHSEYLFRRATSSRTIEEDIQKIINDDALPEMELGFFRMGEGEILRSEKIVVWMATGNIGFSLICEKTENRLLTETILKLLIRYLHEYLRILNQPTEASLKADKVGLVINKFLPEGNLLFMNNRVIRQLEKELETAMKT